MNGLGKYLDNNSNYYHGIFENGLIKKGIKINENSSYEGEFKNGIPNGKVHLYYLNLKGK